MAIRIGTGTYVYQYKKRPTDNKFKWNIATPAMNVSPYEGYAETKIQEKMYNFHRMRGQIMHLLDKIQHKDLTSFSHSWTPVSFVKQDLLSGDMNRLLDTFGFTEENIEDLASHTDDDDLDYFNLSWDGGISDIYKEDADKIKQVYVNEVGFNKDAKDKKRYYSITGSELSKAMVPFFNNFISTNYDKETTKRPSKDIFMMMDEGIGALFPRHTRLDNAIADFLDEDIDLVYKHKKLWKRAFSMLTPQEYLDVFVPLLEVKYKVDQSWWKRLLRVVLVIVAVVTFIYEVVTGFADNGTISDAIMSSANILSSGYSAYSSVKGLTQRASEEIDEDDNEDDDDPDLEQSSEGDTEKGVYAWLLPEPSEVLWSEPERLSLEPEILYMKGEDYAY